MRTSLCGRTCCCLDLTHPVRLALEEQRENCEQRHLNNPSELTRYQLVCAEQRLSRCSNTTECQDSGVRS